MVRIVFAPCIDQGSTGSPLLVRSAMLAFSVLRVSLLAQLTLVPLALALSLAVTENEADVSSMPWYEAVTSYHFPHLYSLDLEASTFLPSLTSSRATYVMIDFYAPWCPHCQHFAPEFERLALAVERSPEENTSVLIANVDCVRSADTCRQWGIDSFPTLLWGKRSDWLESSTTKLERAEVFNAEAAAQWINNRTHAHLDVSHVSKDEVFQLVRQGHDASAMVVAQPGNMSTVNRSTLADTWDAQLAVALLLHGTFATQTFPLSKDKFGNNNISSVKHRALLDFVALLSERFPNAAQDGCRSSLKRLHRELSHNWTQLGEVVTGDDAVKSPAFWIDPNKLEEKWRMCGTEWDKYSQGWHACRGTWPGKRGYTCGLWTTFHMVAANSDDTNAGRDMDVMRDAIRNFFDCDECRQHFLKIPVAAKDTATKKDAQLWWWTAHNFVNHRVGALEVQYQDGDPAFVKEQWPPASVCPSCQRSETNRDLVQNRRSKPRSVGFLSAPQEDAGENRWDLEEVVSFLQRFYGEL